MEIDELLRYLTAVLERLSVPYFVTGSVASMTYGEPRFTQDVDIVADLRETHVAPFVASFPAPDYYISEDAVRTAIRQRRQFNLMHIFNGVKADVIVPPDTEFNQSRMSRRRRMPLGSTGEAMMASPEDVILKKLEYYRDGGSEKHLRDIATIFHVGAFPVDRQYLESWAERLGVRAALQVIDAHLAEGSPPK
jgi:hypothetical protein